MAEVTQRTNQLKACLKAYFPQAIAFLNDNLNSRIACVFLEKFPSLHECHKAGKEQILKALDEELKFCCRSKWEKRLDDMLVSLFLTNDPIAIEIGERKAQHLSKVLLATLETLESYDKAIEETFDRQPAKELFSDLPGAGKQLVLNGISPVLSHENTP